MKGKAAGSSEPLQCDLGQWELGRAEREKKLSAYVSDVVLTLGLLDLDSVVFPDGPACCLICESCMCVSVWATDSQLTVETFLWVTRCMCVLETEMVEKERRVCVCLCGSLIAASSDMCVLELPADIKGQKKKM